MVRPLLPLNALRAFESASRHLNFSRTADELSVTPGAVSQQIRLLEEIIGGPLFTREARGLQLTELGRAATPLLREGFERLMDASAILREPPLNRTVAISVAPSFASKWLMPRMDDPDSSSAGLSDNMGADTHEIEVEVPNASTARKVREAVEALAFDLDALVEIEEEESE